MAAEKCGPRRKKDLTRFMIVTMGDQPSLKTQKLFEAGNFTRYLYLHELFVATAEALMELVHKRARQLLGKARGDSAKVTDLSYKKDSYSRYSFGYPACPSLEDQTKIVKFLEPREVYRCAIDRGLSSGIEAKHKCNFGISPASKSILRPKASELRGTTFP